MLQDLDATIAALLDSELSMENVTISFATPDDQFPPSNVNLPAVALFLYDVREEHALRSTAWNVESSGDRLVTRGPAPARVNCSYLITAWSSESTPQPVADEHRLLGEVLKVLLRHRTIPDQYLRGELVGQAPSLPAKVITEAQLQSLGELWQAMGGRPKATLHYAVTISIDVAEPVLVGRRVEDTILKFSQKE
jgi:hypothetical protein